MLREDVAKLDRLDQETLFLAREGISTMGQLGNRKVAAESKIETLIAQRNDLRKKLRRLTRKENQPATDEIRGQIRQLSQRLKKLRKEVALCENIALRSGQVKENLEQLLTQQNTERKEQIKEVKEAEKIRKSVCSILRQEQRERQPHRKQNMER